MNIGVIGVGNMGVNHARVLSEMGALSAVCDTDEGKVGKIAERFHCPYYLDYREMVEREGLQGAIIATPTTYHRDIALFCLEEGINVLVEKPLAGDVEEAKEVIDASSGKNHKILMVGHVERFNPVVPLAKEHIAENTTSAGFRRLGLMPPLRDTDVVFDLAIHDLDIARYLFGELELVSAAGVEKDGLLEHVNATFRARKTLVNMEASRLSPVKVRSFHTIDQDKMLEANYITQSMDIYKSLKTSGYPASFGEFLLRGLQAQKETLSLIPEEPLKLEDQHFIECIKEDKPPLITPQEVLATMRLSEEIRDKVVI